MTTTTPRIQITEVYRSAGKDLVRLAKVANDPGQGEYMLTDNGLLVLGRCKNGMEFEVTYTRGSEALHRKFTISGGAPFIKLRGSMKYLLACMIFANACVGALNAHRGYVLHNPSLLIAGIVWLMYASGATVAFAHSNRRKTK